MALFSKKKKKNEDVRAVSKRKPFEQREEVHPLSCVFTIVERNQSHYYEDAYTEAGASMVLTLYAHSQPPEEIVSVLGDLNLKKDIVVALCREEDAKKLLAIAKERFAISKAAKGIAFSCPIESVNGIAAYRFLADQDRALREENK